MTLQGAGINEGCQIAFLPEAGFSGCAAAATSGPLTVGADSEKGAMVMTVKAATLGDHKA